jgi:hypothetical protein
VGRQALPGPQAREGEGGVELVAGRRARVVLVLGNAREGGRVGGREGGREGGARGVGTEEEREGGKEKGGGNQ